MEKAIKSHKNALVNIICLAVKVLSFCYYYMHNPNLHVSGIQLRVVHDREAVIIKGFGINGLNEYLFWRRRKKKVIQNRWGKTKMVTGSK